MLNHKGTQEIRTQRLVLRKIRESDYKDIFRYTSKDEVAKYVTWNTHQKIENTKVLCKMWADQYKSGDKYHWAILLDGTVIGNIEIPKIIDGTAFLGWQIDSCYWNKGIMTEAASAVRDYMFTEIGVETLGASYIKENIGSGRVMQKIGMTEVNPEKYFEKLKNTEKEMTEFDGMPLGFCLLSRKEWICNKLTVRIMKPNDYDEVYALWKNCKGVGLYDIDDSKNGIERFLNRNPDTCFIAEICGRIIGSVLSGDDGRRGYIYHMAVDENFRGNGIATELLECALTALKRNGVSKTALVVFKDNEAGNAFWDKAGFQKREELRYRNKLLVE